MSHLPFTLLAYFLNSLAVVIDKFLLVKHISNPLVYVFYFSAFSMLALIVLPFTPQPTLYVFAIASLSTLIWTLGAYFMYKALQIGQATRVIPMIGTFIPLTLLTYYGIFLHNISANEIRAIVAFTLGLIFLTLPYLKGKLKPQELLFELLSAILFAFSYVILREAYLHGPFLTVFAWSRIILIPVGMIMLSIPVLRKDILTAHGPKLSLASKPGLLFLFGQFSGGMSELLLTYSVFLANPALVNSLQGTQYIFIFAMTLLLAKKFPQIFDESFSFFTIMGKILGIALIAYGLYILAFFSKVSV